MTREKISEYDAVAANNTDVNGVNIAENCPPSGMNNMGREIMAALKRFQTGADGDSVTVGGSLVVSGSVTAANTATLGNVDINGGTIDGTAIGGASAATGAFTTLNTSGAVVFNDAGADVDFRVESDTNENAFFLDGATGNIGVGVVPSAWGSTWKPIQMAYGGSVFANTGVADIGLSSNAYWNNTSLTSNGVYIQSDAASYYRQSEGIHYWYGAASGTAGNPITFTERMRITSGGYFKASNTGTYNVPTGSSHELRSDANSTVARITSSIASGFGDAILQTSFTAYTPNATGVYFLYCNDPTNLKASILSTGTFESRTNTYGGVSDIKLKQDIVDANSQWDDIKGLRVRKFRMKDEVAADPNYPAHLGLIAQEAELVSPGLVFESPDTEKVTRTREVEKTREVEVTPAVLDEDGNVVEPAVMETETYTEEEEYTETVDLGTTTKSVKYSILYMKAVKALQEAMERIETLEAKVAALENA